MSFLTLTISQHDPVPAPAAHAALKVFLQHFRRPAGKKEISERLKSYVWKAELQKRGQIHYHLTTNCFLHWAEVQRVWNGIQDRRGWLKDYRVQYGKSNPNSTDIHSVYKVKDIGAYLSKYLSKTSADPALNVKIWDCSNDLKVKRFSTELDTGTKTNIRLALRQVKLLKLEHCELLQQKRPALLLSPEIRKDYDTWLIS